MIHQKRLGTDSLAVHAGRGDLHKIPAHAPPLDLSSTYPLADLEWATADFDAWVAGKAHAANPIYARLHNPTVARYEDALAAMEGAEAAVAYGSGMAAVTACLLDARTRGRNVVAIRPLYGTTDHLLESGMLGLEVRWGEAERVGEAIDADTALVFLETPGNPTLEMIDIEAVVRQAGPVPVLVDSTFATPVLQNPLAFGAAYALHSATKFLSGHGDVIGGIVACSEERAQGLRRVRLMTGALLHPLAAFLLHRALPTLPVRVRRAQENAKILAERLASHAAVARVLYPGLPGGDPEGLLGRQMRGPGAILSFVMKGGYDAAAAVMRGVKLITAAVSLGSTDTLIQHPAGLTHRVVEPSARERTGIGEGLLRLAVGLEDAEDLWDDLERALASAERIAAAPTVAGI
jgi:cystathionine beta-lyase/cystathionine gamma-synthase